MAESARIKQEAQVRQDRTGSPRSARLPRDERRAQLLNAALEVFVANGFHGAAMDEIAETAHVSKPVLYQHFPSKRELYMALLDSHLATLTDQMLTALNSTSDNKERVQAVMRAYYRFIAGDDQAHRLVFESDLINDRTSAPGWRLSTAPSPTPSPRSSPKTPSCPRWRPSCWAGAWREWRRSARGIGSKPTAIWTSMSPAT
ncbi:fatty acid metabolism regulator protein [Arthrobacter sp. Hiyo8]|nr:fatty acid metabolism regulator protein [Arthrobacter sp. Hiyo8]